MFPLVWKLDSSNFWEGVKYLIIIRFFVVVFICGSEETDVLTPESVLLISRAK